MSVDITKLTSNEIHESLKELTRKEKQLEVDILTRLREVSRRKYFIWLGYHSLADYCAGELELSIDGALKRSQAANVITFHPEFLDLLRDGKTYVSHLSLIAPHVTQANKGILLEYMPGRSKRDLKLFLSQLGHNGKLLEVEPTVEIRLACSETFLNKLDHAHGLLAQTRCKRGHEAILERALDVLIEKIDPMKKAERAADRAERKEAGKGPVTTQNLSPASKTVSKSSVRDRCSGAGGPERNFPEDICSGAGGPERNFPEDICSGAGGPEKRDPNDRQPIAAAVRHKIFLRDGGRCTYVGPSGFRCQQTSMLQIDHIYPRSLGGRDEIENLRILCPQHNRLAAEAYFGQRK